MSLRRVDSDEFFLSTGQGLRWAVMAFESTSGSDGSVALAAVREPPPGSRWEAQGASRRAGSGSWSSLYFQLVVVHCLS